MGCINANNQNVFYTQIKNGTETFLLYEKNNDGLNHYTETCGPTSLWNGLEAMNIDIKPLCFNGLLRPADVMFEYLNTPSNFSNFPQWAGCVPGQIPGNEVQYWHPIALKNLFNVDSVFHSGLTFDDVANILNEGHAVQLGRKIGHFICAVDYDKASDTIFYWDSFPNYIQPDGSIIDDGTGGFRRQISRQWFTDNLSTNFIELVGFAS